MIRSSQQAHRAASLYVRELPILSGSDRAIKSCKDHHCIIIVSPCDNVPCRYLASSCLHYTMIASKFESFIAKVAPLVWLASTSVVFFRQWYINYIAGFTTLLVWHSSYCTVTFLIRNFFNFFMLKVKDQESGFTTAVYSRQCVEILDLVMQGN